MTRDEVREREDAIRDEYEAEVEAARASESEDVREGWRIINAAAVRRERQLDEARAKRDRMLTELRQMAREEAER